MPVLATYFSVRRGRDPFFKFFMRTLFPRQVKRVRGEVRHPLPRLVQRRLRLGLRQRDPARAARLRDPRQARGRRGHRAPSGTGPANGSSSATTRCSCASGWDPTSSTTRRPMSRRDCRRRAPKATDRTGATWTRPQRPARGDRATPRLERSDFLVQCDRAAPQVPRGEREPDQRAGRPDPDRRGSRLPVVAPDLTFRSRSRYLDDDTGEWVSETEVIESAAELVELYNPADMYAAFAEAAREAAGLPPSRPATEELLEAAGIARRGDRRPVGERPVRRRGRRLGRGPAGEPSTPTTKRPPRSACTTSRSSSRSAASAARRASSSSSRTRVRAADRQARRPDHRRRRGRAARRSKRRGRFQAEVLPEDDRRRVAALTEPRRARRVLRPDRRVRRPRRRAGRGVSRRSRRRLRGAADEDERRRPRPTRPTRDGRRTIAAETRRGRAGRPARGGPPAA